MSSNFTAADPNYERRTLCVTTGEVYAMHEGKRVLCALMQQTLVVMHGRADHRSGKP